MKLKDLPEEILAFLPEGTNLEADINDPIIPLIPVPPKHVPLLHWACKNNLTELIEMLVTNREEYGLNINALDADNNPALAYVTANCFVVQILIEAGADLTIPLHLDVMGAGTPILPIDLFLGSHESQFLLMKGVSAAFYDRHFYEKDKTKLAITLTEATTASLGSDILHLISAYAFGLSNDITERKAVHEFTRLSNMCKRAYHACKKDQCLDALYNEVGASGINNLVALANLVGKNGIEKLAASLKQPTPSARPEQNAHPAVLSFISSSSSSSSSSASSSSRPCSSSSSSPVPSVTIHTTSASSNSVQTSSSSSSSSSSSASANGNLSSHSSSNSNRSNNRLNPRINHPRWGSRPR